MNNLICDMHVHTKFSCDSDANLEAYCLQAIEKGLHAICFTEHVDHNKNDYGYGYYNAEGFFKEFLPLKEKFQDKLTLLSGIEFSEPHLYQDELSELSKLPYDFILGSVHYWYQDMFPSSMVKADIPVKTCYEHYWSEVLAAIKAGGFDVLAHLDFPKRYYHELIIDSDKLHQICGEMARNDICLELNTSSLRKNAAEAMPDRELLSIYQSCGGKYITIGSDAHSADELSADYLYAKKLIDYFGFEEVIFKRRSKCPPLVRREST